MFSKFFCLRYLRCVIEIIIQLITNEETTKDINTWKAFSGIILLIKIQIAAKKDETKINHYIGFHQN